MVEERAQRNRAANLQREREEGLPEGGLSRCGKTSASRFGKPADGQINSVRPERNVAESPPGGTACSQGNAGSRRAVLSTRSVRSSDSLGEKEESETFRLQRSTPNVQ